MNSRIKLSARFALNGSYIKVIPLLTAVIFIGFVILVSDFVFGFMFPYADVFATVIFFTAVFFVASAVTGPLRFRLEIKHLSLAVKGIMPPKTSVKEIVKACGMCVTLFMLKLFWFLVYELIPIISAVVFAAYVSFGSVSLRAAYVIFAGIAVAAFSGICFYFFAIQRYSKAMFYLACYENIGVFDAIKESVRKTEKKLGEILLFKLSFLPWFLLCLGIVPALFVIPYYKQSITCRFLCDR